MTYTTDQANIVNYYIERVLAGQDADLMGRAAYANHGPLVIEYLDNATVWIDENNGEARIADITSALAGGAIAAQDDVIADRAEADKVRAASAALHAALDGDMFAILDALAAHGSAAAAVEALAAKEA